MLSASVRPTDVEGFVRAARALTPTIRALRTDIERERNLPAPLVRQMADAGFFSLWLASALGGPELTTVDFLRVIEELSRATASSR